MTSAIKPPSGSNSVPTQEQNSSLDEVKGTQDGAAATQSADQAQSAASVSEPTSGGFTSQVAAELKAGRIDMPEAVNRLVHHAMQEAGAAQLPEAQQQELETYLRQTLADDPALAALARDLEST